MKYLQMLISALRGVRNLFGTKTPAAPLIDWEVCPFKFSLDWRLVEDDLVVVLKFPTARAVPHVKGGIDEGAL